MNLTEYASHDGLGLAELVRRRQVLPLELARLALSAVEHLNPRLNAVISVFHDEVEQAVRAAPPGGAFAGVPFLVKDLALVVGGKPTRMGSRLFDKFVAPDDSELMARYRRAGLVTLGKTNCPELGLSFTTESVLSGPCHNPWNPERTPGGSSGGAAAAVASRMVPLAHGNDGGGSIRVPASCCGLFGLKPTRGRTPVGPYLAEGWNGLGIDHALTRSVRDSAALLDATAGADVGAAYAAAPPSRAYLEEVSREPGRLRIAFSARTAVGVQASEDSLHALRRTVTLCQELGHELVETEPVFEHEQFRSAYYGIVSANLAFTLDAVAPMFAGATASPENVEAANLALAARGRAMSASEFLGCQALMNQVSRQVGHFFTGFDALLTPTLPEPPLPLGLLDSNGGGIQDGYDFLDRLLRVSPYTALYNLTGQPAMSVPLHHGADGLPLGMHFVGRYGDEATLFRLAGQLERAAPWASRRPPLCA